MSSQDQYRKYQLPRFAPPAWVFGPVWTVLYTIIAITFAFVGYQAAQGSVPIWVTVPFVLNLLANALFTPLQFRWRKLRWALVDIFVVDATLVWALVVIRPFAPWVAYANVPYLCWVAFATVLQIAVVRANAPQHNADATA